MAFGKKKDRFLESRHLGGRGFCGGTVRALGRERLLLVAPTTGLKGHVLAFGWEGDRCLVWALGRETVLGTRADLGTWEGEGSAVFRRSSLAHARHVALTTG